ncbi:hypothetical protein [Nocardioides sp.]|uniref:hypothetical protein n=1 Tax=Nocardioides sp. TaxID=35761 RepID=UPI002622BDD3|nr:hypothetical protein [Nocardioides sp.]MDI6912057.1 hypothetical protein [Nocardioides sp.]
MLPRFVPAGRRRPVDLVVPGSSLAEVCAPYAAVTGPGPRLELRSGDDLLVARYDGAAAWLEVTAGGRTSRHRSRRFARTEAPARAVGLALTGTHLSVLTRGPGPWLVRGRVDLRDRVDTRDEAWLARLRSDAPVAGRFGQLGLRDLRRVDGVPGGRVLLSATSAGPGFFDTAHTSLWELDPETLGLTHLSDVFFRRPDRPGAYGDHATHVLRDGDEWLVATSTWGDFDRRRPTVGVTLARTTADLLNGTHLLDTEPLALPVDGLGSVGVWDPHLVRSEDGWLVGFVSATRFFRFHPAVAAGPTLGDLTLRGAATDLTQTEGTTLAHLDGAWRVLASDKVRRRYPVFDLDLRETGALEAPYPTNIPWPTLVPTGDSWLLVGFNGRPSGGPLPGYGTHGDVVVARAVHADYGVS